MIGSAYWSTGISVGYSDERWVASAKFLDDGFANDDVDDLRISTEGTLHTRYYVRDGKHVDALTVVIDTVKADAERLGIVWKDPHIYVNTHDGEVPAAIQRLVDRQAVRLGWEPLNAEDSED
jgi:hypothetical protein